MAGSIVEKLTSHPSSSLSKLSLAFTCTAGGEVSGIPTTLFNSGEIVRIVYKHGTVDGGGFVLNDSDSKDVLLTLGASGAVDKDLVPLLGDGATTWGRVFVAGPLTLVVTTGGVSTSGELIIYWR